MPADIRLVRDLFLLEKNELFLAVDLLLHGTDGSEPP